MNRDRSYYRKMRAKHIRRKKKIGTITYGEQWHYKHDGMYSKGKVHCSCMLCRAKTRNKGRGQGHTVPAINYKHSDQVKVQRMDNQHKDYLDHESAA